MIEIKRGETFINESNKDCIIFGKASYLDNCRENVKYIELIVYESDNGINVMEIERFKKAFDNGLFLKERPTTGTARLVIPDPAWLDIEYTIISKEKYLETFSNDVELWVQVEDTFELFTNVDADSGTAYHYSTFLGEQFIDEFLLIREGAIFSEDLENFYKIEDWDED